VSIAEGYHEMIGCKRDEAIALRDALLREFPLEGDQLIGRSGQSVAKERRERIATAIFAAMHADPEAHRSASLAIDSADTLIAVLDKVKP
jgi:hypothetical protein